MAICTGCEQETFRYQSIHGKGDFCRKCAPLANVMNLTTFPFTAQHLDPTGHPTEVRSLYHLRQLEHQHGLACAAYSDDSTNHFTPRPTDFSRIGVGAVLSGRRSLIKRR